jgi:hypothetical protein
LRVSSMSSVPPLPLSGAEGLSFIPPEVSFYNEA